MLLYRAGQARDSLFTRRLSRVHVLSDIQIARMYTYSRNILYIYAAHYRMRNTRRVFLPSSRRGNEKLVGNDAKLRTPREKRQKNLGSLPQTDNDNSPS